MINLLPVSDQKTNPLIFTTITPPAQVQPIEEKKEPVTYTVQDGDNLTKIAEKYNTTWLRLWNKNASLINQDSLLVGQVLTIPTAEEVLTERPLYTIQSTTVSSQVSVKGNGYTSVGFDPSGGWCTNYIARKRPIPAWFQNADMWLINARQASMPTGRTPQAGSVAVAASYMHVAYVEKVDGNRVYVSEQNYKGYGIVSSRWSDVSEWQGYIY